LGRNPIEITNLGWIHKFAEVCLTVFVGVFRKLFFELLGTQEVPVEVYIVLVESAVVLHAIWVESMDKQHVALGQTFRVQELGLHR